MGPCRRQMTGKRLGPPGLRFSGFAADRHRTLMQQAVPGSPLSAPRQLEATGPYQIMTNRIREAGGVTGFTFTSGKLGADAFHRQSPCECKVDQSVAFPPLPAPQCSPCGNHERIGPIGAMIDDAAASPPPHPPHAGNRRTGFGKFTEIPETAPFPVPAVNPEQRLGNILQQPIIHRHRFRTRARAGVHPKLQAVENHRCNPYPQRATRAISLALHNETDFATCESNPRTRGFPLS